MMNSIHIHPLSDVKSNNIGSGTTIWQYCVILPNATIGKECNICAHVLIENDVIVGDKVTVKSGVQLWDGVRVGDNVFIGPNVTFTNDKFPRSKRRPGQFLETVVSEGASIGANATILPGIKIGAGALIGAGTVVTRNVPPNAIVLGNPGRIISYTETQSKFFADSQNIGPSHGPIGKVASALSEIHFQTIPIIEDNRGALSFGEFSKQIPFEPKRYFLVFNVPDIETRGEHAHRVCEQFLICVKGSCNVVLDDGHSRYEVMLNSPIKGLYIPPMIWGIQYKYSKDAVLLVFASHFYDSNDYIRDYSEFLNEINQRK